MCVCVCVCACVCECVCVCIERLGYETKLHMVVRFKVWCS